MQTTKHIKWGILGLGKIAHKFATDLKTVSGCELHAVASRNQEKADDFAQQYGSKIAYDSYEKLAKDSEKLTPFILRLHIVLTRNIPSFVCIIKKQCCAKKHLL